MSNNKNLQYYDESDFLDLRSFTMIDNKNEGIERVKATNVDTIATSNANLYTGKQRIEQLIMDDYVHSQLYRSAKVLNPERNKESVRQSQKSPLYPAGIGISSPHVLDLRTTHRVLKRGLIVEIIQVILARLRYFRSGMRIANIAIQRSLKSLIRSGTFVVQLQPIASRYSMPRTTKHSTQVNWSWKFRVRTVSAFSLILLIILLPVHSIIFLNTAVETTKATITSNGLLAVSKLHAGLSDIFKNPNTARTDLALANSGFKSIQAELSQYNDLLVNLANSLPNISTKLSLTSELSIIGEQLSIIGILIANQMESSSELIPLTGTIQTLHRHLSVIEDSMNTVKNDIISINPSSVPREWHDTIERFQSLTQVISLELKKINAFLLTSYNFLGGDGTSRQLILFQNNRELRATGGFIGSFAQIDFDKGAIRNIYFPGAGTYELEGSFRNHLIPPKPLSILNNEWFIWDANWWPDFATSAQKIMWFYEESKRPTVDGVMSINSDIMIEILKMTGPIALDEYSLVVDSHNFYDVIQNEVQFEYDKELNEPKKVLTDLYPLLVDRLLTMENKIGLLDVLFSALSNKDIQLYFSDSKQQTIVEAYGWGGRMKQTDSDYLAVISTNIAGGKSDDAIFETIDHRAEIANNGQVTVTTKITKEHRAGPNDFLAYLNNVDFMRIYVPRGSQLLSAIGFEAPEEHYFITPEDFQIDDSDLVDLKKNELLHAPSGTLIYDELDNTVFANWMQILPGETKSVVLQYQLPSTIHISTTEGVHWLNYWNDSYTEIDSYSLLIQKQSGKDNTILNSSVILGDKFRVVWHDALHRKNLTNSGSFLTYSTDLSSDSVYAILLAKQKSGNEL